MVEYKVCMQLYCADCNVAPNPCYSQCFALGTVWCSHEDKVRHNKGCKAAAEIHHQNVLQEFSRAIHGLDDTCQQQQGHNCNQHLHSRVNHTTMSSCPQTHRQVLKPLDAPDETTAHLNHIGIHEPGCEQVPNTWQCPARGRSQRQGLAMPAVC